MSIRPVTIYGEPVLHVRAKEVTEFNDELRELINDMYDTMDAANGVGWLPRRSAWACASSPTSTPTKTASRHAAWWSTPA